MPAQTMDLQRIGPKSAIGRLVTFFHFGPASTVGFGSLPMSVPDAVDISPHRHPGIKLRCCLRSANVRIWLRLLKKSVDRWCEDLPDLILQRTNGTSGRLYGPTQRQDEVLGSSAGSFVSKVHEASQWARNFAICACRGLFQQPRLGTAQNQRCQPLPLAPQPRIFVRRQNIWDN